MPNHHKKQRRSREEKTFFTIEKQDKLIESVDEPSLKEKLKEHRTMTEKFVSYDLRKANSETIELFKEIKNFRSKWLNGNVKKWGTGNEKLWEEIRSEFIKYNTCFLTPFLVKSMIEWFFEKQIGLGMFYHSDNGLLLIIFELMIYIR